MRRAIVIAAMVASTALALVAWGFGDHDATPPAIAQGPHVVHFWATWCVACRVEHAFVGELATAARIPVYAITPRDDAADVARWLDHFGNPYRAVYTDDSGKVMDAFAVSRLPVTLVVDGSGRIRGRHAGALDERTLRDVLLPRIRQVADEERREIHATQMSPIELR